LYYLETLVGTEAFEAFARSYVIEFQYGTLTSGEFRDFFMSHFISNPGVESLDWTMLLCSRGLPTHPHTVFTNPLSLESISLCDAVNTFAKNESESSRKALKAVDVSVRTFVLGSCFVGSV
jgi:hypothetical protein